MTEGENRVQTKLVSRKLKEMFSEPANRVRNMVPNEISAFQRYTVISTQITISFLYVYLTERHVDYNGFEFCLTS